MVLGVHPEVVELDGGGGFADVLGDEAELDAGGGSAGGEFGFAGELVGDGGVGGHLAGVGGRGGGEERVAMELREAEGGALPIGRCQQVLLGDGGRVRGVGSGTLCGGGWAEAQQRRQPSDGRDSERCENELDPPQLHRSL